MKVRTTVYLDEELVEGLKKVHIDNISDMVNTFMSSWIQNHRKSRSKVADLTMKSMDEYQMILLKEKMQETITLLQTLTKNLEGIFLD